MSDQKLDADDVLVWLEQMSRALTHDLNQPLAAAANYLAAARQIARAKGVTALDPALERASEQIGRASRALQKLSASLTPSEPRLERTALHGVVTRAAERLSRKGIEATLSLDAPDDLVLADPTQVEEALAGLMEVAVEGVASALSVVSRGQHDAIRLEILAFPKEEGPIALHNFARAATSIAGALARAILEAHDGTLERMPDGDGFAVTLPLAGVAFE